MITVSQAIITWLKTFSAVDYWKMNSIKTDIQPAEADTYALTKEPIVNKKVYVSGKEVHTDHYTLSARLSNNSNSDMIDNNAWGELLEEWVYEQNKAGNYPQIPNAVVNKISVTTPFYLGTTDTNSCIYQLSISINYMKG